MIKLKEIEGFRYDITSDGKIYSYRSKKNVKIENGMVTLWDGNTPYEFNFHKLFKKYFPSGKRLQKTFRTNMTTEQIEEIVRLRIEESRTFEDISRVMKMSKAGVYKAYMRFIRL